jgi:hypothetical protein
MCFNPSPERRVPSPNRYMAFAKFCFCKNNKRTIDRFPPDKLSSAASGFPRGGGRGKDWGRGKGGRAAGQESIAPTGKCFVCGKVGCKPSTCPNGNPDAQKEHAAKQAERARANANRQVCLLSPLASPNSLISDPELPSKVFPKFLGTICYDLSHKHGDAH